MKAPKCKLCGEEHWSPVCPKFGGRRAVPDIKAIEAKAKSAGTKKSKPKPRKLQKGDR